MDKYNCIELQKEKGLQIIRDLYDLKKIIPSLKITENLYFNLYNEEDLYELEERVRNWQSETITSLSVIGFDVDSYRDAFEPKEDILSIGDKRKALADEMKAGLFMLAKIDITNSSESYPANEVAFLKKEIHFDTAKLTPELIPVIHSLIEEIEKGISVSMPLSVVVLSGSALECILLDLAKKNAKTFNKSKNAPKENHNKILPFGNWKLIDLINVAVDLGFLSVDIRVFCHGLRNFRNYVHPNVHIVNDFHPDMHTAKICFQVLKEAISEISERSELIGAKKDSKEN